MHEFLVQHADILIMIVGGLFACFYGYRPSPADQDTESRQRRNRILRVCGPLLIFVGIVLAVLNQSAPLTWQRYYTSDNCASAEFPGKPKAQEKSISLEGNNLLQVSLAYKVPAKDIALNLTYSPIPPDDLNAAEADRIAGIKAYFEQQGLTIVREYPVQLGAVSGFALDVQDKEGRQRTWTRIAYVSESIYRVVAVSVGPNQQDEIVDRFLKSFRIERAQPEPKSPPAQKQAAKRDITTIKYSGTFEIVGTDKTGLTLNELAVALRQRARDHPEQKYEVLAEFKCVPEESDKVIKTIRDTGAKLKHYWAPVSLVPIGSKPGPYGIGHVDIAGEKQ